MSTLNDARQPAGAADDYNSPAQRLNRYRLEVLRRRSKCAEYLGLLAMVDLVIVSNVLKAELSGWGWSSLLIVPVMLMGSDVYELVRDLIEYMIFYPKYDRASQPKPEFKVTTGLGPYRSYIYLIVAPVLPTAFIWVLRSHGQIHLPPMLPSWGLAFYLSLATLVFRAYGLPLSLRELIEPFKRVPSPDVH